MRATSLPVTLACVQRAATRIAGSGMLRTPVISSAWADEACGLRVFFKCEHLQHTGSFKFRGAANAVLQLSDDDAAKGVVAHSAGNHGAALAAAAKVRDIPCTIVIPRDTPEAKLANIRRFGARIVLCEPTQQARSQTAALEAEKMGGAKLVHPYDDTEVIAGQGTIALELLESCPQLDAILVPTSGGGMLGGIAAAACELKPGLRVIAVEPKGKRLAEAFASGQRVIDPTSANKLLPTCKPSRGAHHAHTLTQAPPRHSGADAIRTQPLGIKPWALAQKWVDRTVLTVADAEIAAATRLALSELKQMVEPAGAVTLAALLSPSFASLRDEAAVGGKPLRSVAAILCGGNTDLESLFRMVS